MLRDEILDTLSAVLPAEFEAIIFHLEVPRGILSGTQTPQTTRAIEVINYLEAKGRLPYLVPLLRSVQQRHPPPPPPPPEYESKAVRAIAEELEHARERRATLLETGASVKAVDSEILALRSRLRQGGQLRAGDTLGERYTLIRSLGRGGFASVWEAHDRARFQRVAVKVLHPDLARDASRRERFFRGARVMAGLDHPAVVRVMEPHGEDEGYFYFVMELVPGGDLQRAVLDNVLTSDDAMSLMVHVSEALAVAHAKGIVHRDVKPANILLDAKGQPKLTDFDLVAAVDTTGGTRTGHMGTFLFMAPEPANNVTARADVYSLGMTAIFCLYGRELPMTAVRHPDKVIAELPCDEGMKQILTRAIELEPEARYEDARTFGEVLRAANQAHRARQEKATRELLARRAQEMMRQHWEVRIGAEGAREFLANLELPMRRQSVPDPWRWSRRAIWLVVAALSALGIGAALWSGQEVIVTPAGGDAGTTARAKSSEPMVVP